MDLDLDLHGNFTHLAQDEADVDENSHQDEEGDGPYGDLSAVLPTKDESPEGGCENMGEWEYRRQSGKRRGPWVIKSKRRGSYHHKEGYFSLSEFEMF